MGRHNNEFTNARDVRCRAEAPNLGIGIGIGIASSHAFATKTTLDDLDMLDADRLFFVLLVDFGWNEMPALEGCINAVRHFSVFSGEGVHGEQCVERVMRRDRLGDRGDHSFEVFNDDGLQMPLAALAECARRRAVWQGEDLLHRSAHLPARMRLQRRACGALRQCAAMIDARIDSPSDSLI